MVKRRLQRLLADNSGAAAVVMALTLPVVLGGMGLGTEVGYWYFNQRKVQNAADMAGATVSMNGGASIHLGAPTSGAYSGVLMFVGRSEPYNDYTVNGNSGIDCGTGRSMPPTATCG